MTELDQDALDAVEHRGKYLVPKELLKLIERYDENAEYGVEIERLETYIEALAERGVPTIDLAELEDLIEQNLTEQESWADPDAIYAVGDGISAFPARWHEELTGEDDLKEYVDLISGDLSSEGKDTATGAAGEGVPQQLLLDAASALGPYSRDGVKAEIEELREEGEVREPADQHPESRIWPTTE